MPPSIGADAPARSPGLWTLSKPSPSEPRPDRRLPLDEVLADLVADGLIGAPAAQSRLRGVSQRGRAEPDSLELVAAASSTTPNPPAGADPGGAHTLARRREWPRRPAHRSSQGRRIQHGRPRHRGGRRLELHPADLAHPRAGGLCHLGALAQGLELRGIVKREIVRVVAKPGDIERYRREFFRVPGFIKGAASGDSDRRLEIGNLEALVELGKSGQIDANDGHSVHIVDWLLQYAFDQGRAASTGSPAGTWVTSASESTGSCTRSTRSPPRPWPPSRAGRTEGSLGRDRFLGPSGSKK